MTTAEAERATRQINNLPRFGSVGGNYQSLIQLARASNVKFHRRPRTCISALCSNAQAPKNLRFQQANTWPNYNTQRIRWHAKGKNGKPQFFSVAAIVEKQILPFLPGISSQCGGHRSIPFTSSNSHPFERVRTCNELSCLSAPQEPKLARHGIYFE